MVFSNLFEIRKCRIRLQNFVVVEIRRLIDDAKLLDVGIKVAPHDCVRALIDAIECGANELLNLKALIHHAL